MRKSWTLLLPPHTLTGKLQIASRRRHHHNTKTSFLSNLEDRGNQGPKDELVDDSRQAAIEELGECLKAIGNDGKDAEARTTTNQKTYALLSLATKSSYKDKKSGEYVSHTEWHGIVVWGKLGEFASSIKKGTHLLVEGELRSREYTDKDHQDVKRRVWEVRADSILKLDRAEQAPPDDQFDAGPAQDEEPS